MGKRMKAKVVDFIPRQLEDKVIYISYLNEVAIHKCACGCGNEIVTPLSKKNGWVIKEDERGITLYPSIGNYAFPCKSHYWIRGGEIVWIRDQRGQNVFVAYLQKLLGRIKKFI